MSKKSVKHKGTPSFSSDYRNSWPRKLTRIQEKSSVACSVLLIPFRCGQVQGGRRKIPQSFPRERVCKFPHKNGNFRGTPFRSPNFCNMKTPRMIEYGHCLSRYPWLWWRLSLMETKLLKVWLNWKVKYFWQSWWIHNCWWWIRQEWHWSRLQLLWPGKIT